MTASESQTPISPAQDVIRQVRRHVGDRIRPQSYVQVGDQCLTALDLAGRLLNEHRDTAAAARHLADGISSGRIRIVAKPETPWTRSQRIAHLAEQQRTQPRPELVGFEVLEQLGRGRRIHATRHGATRAAPVRDHRGRIDVLATAREHGLVQDAEGPEDFQAARLDAADLATQLAFH